VTQNYRKSWRGTEFNNVIFFIFPLTTSSCVARIYPALEHKKVKNCRKCVAKQSSATGTVSGAGTFFFLDRAWGGGQKMDCLAYV